jgi:hypothetical protein
MRSSKGPRWAAQDILILTLVVLFAIVVLATLLDPTMPAIERLLPLLAGLLYAALRFSSKENRK